MWDYITGWYRRKFSDPDAVTLFLLLLIGFVIIVFFGGLLIPLLVAVALAYLLEWPVQRLTRVGIRRLFAVLIVFSTFLTFCILSTLLIVPVIWQQSAALLVELPDMFAHMQQLLNNLPEMFPGYVDHGQIAEFIQSLKGRALEFGEVLISQSINSLASVMTVMIYLIVVPLLLFFMLKDRAVLIGHVNHVLPNNRRLISQVGSEMNLQIMNYIRGKAIEVLVVGVFTYFCFMFFDLRYAALLAVLVGLSVLIPYIGAILVTLPVVLVALFQFGWTGTFAWVVVAYAVIQIIDGNVLVPLLFSEAVSLNPVYIIGAVLIFGGLWGFWGVFFAIPLASLVKAVLTALSSNNQYQLPLTEET